METETSQVSANNSNINCSLVLSRFFESAPLMMGVADLEGNDIRHIIHNQTTAEFFHFDINGMKGKLASEAGVPHDLIAKWVGHYREAQETRKPVRFEYVHNGIDLFVTVDFIEMADSGFPRFSYFVQDVTHQRRNEKALADEQEFKILANKLPQIIWTADADFTIDWYNDRWFEFTGASKGADWNDQYFHYLHPEDAKETRDYLEGILKEDKAHFEMELRIKRGHDGEYRWHLVRGVSIRDSLGNILRWVGANTDIHDHKKSLRELEEEREVRHRFVTTLTHDLRTPLTASKIGAQIIARKASSDPIILKTTQRIVENMDRADNMIRDLLDASYLSAGQVLALKYEKLSLNQLVREILEEQAIMYGDRFELIEWKEAEGMWDKSALRRILENLLSNAIKYGEPFAPITITLTAQENAAQLAVHNHGKPLSEVDQKRLFRNFSRTDSAKSSLQPGWGIGLTLVRGLTVSMRGQVSLHSTEFEGTTFTVTLPLNGVG